MARGRPLKPLAVSQDTHEELASMARSRSLPVDLVYRAEIVLLCAEGLDNSTVAEWLRVSRKTVGRWRERFRTQSFMGLYDEHRLGRSRTISDDTVMTLLRKTLATRPPDGRTHWTCRAMAEATRVSKSMVLCVDEKSQIQVLERTQPPPAPRAGLRRGRDTRLYSPRYHCPLRRPGRRSPPTKFLPSARRAIATRSSWASSSMSMPTCPQTSTSTSSSTTTPPTSTSASNAGWPPGPATISTSHAHLRFLAQPGRDLVPCHYAGGHPPRLLFFRHPTPGEDPPLHRPLQPRCPALCVDRHRRLYPPQDSEIMHGYFRDRTLVTKAYSKRHTCP